MSIIPEVQERLLTAFPRSSHNSLFRAVQEGIYVADHLYDEGSILNNLIGNDMRGHLRRVGISAQIDKYCERGDLPFIAEMKAMPKGSWHWLEIRSTGAIAHVVRTDDVFSFPDEADSRQDIRVALQGNLLSWSPEKKKLDDIIREIPILYAWLTFRVGRDGRLAHLCWASPADDVDVYVGHINILRDIEESGSPPPAPDPTPDPKDKLKLKDHILKALEKRKDKKSGE
jgi:hypothetical protein